VQYGNAFHDHIQVKIYFADLIFKKKEEKGSVPRIDAF